MPSASAKLEKQASIEANDPLKQITTMVEKKVRNLEKRKGKLDAYRSDSNSGKELNEDQKKAMEKYDLVVEVLDFAKELQKSFFTILQETSKSQKRVAKREYQEKQQLELLRIKEIVMIQDILNSMGGEDVRNDFLNGTNGAVKLAEDELNSLDELFKLVCPERDDSSTETSEFEKQLLAAAEHLQSLLDGKNKEVIGTSYKALNEIIFRIRFCKYFNKSKEEPTNEKESAETPPAETRDSSAESEPQFPYCVNEAKQPVSEPQVPVEQPYFRHEISPYQNQAVIPEVLPVQGNLNFLQESQIDLDSPHLEQPVLPQHSVPAGYASNFTSAAQATIPPPHFQQQRTKEDSNLASHVAVAPILPPVQPPSGLNFASSALQPPNPAGTPADFDPNRPIPTQTYTNQSFTSAIHPMMATVPQSYVPATLAHSLQQQRILPVTMVAQQRNIPTPTSAVLDPTALPSSTHSPSNLLPVSSAAVSMSKMSLTAHDAKEHFVNREFQLPQASREGHHQNKTAPGNSQFDRVNSHEGYQSTNNSHSFLGHENFSTDSSSYSSNLKRGLPPRGITRGSGGNRGVAMNSSRGNRSAYRN